MTELQPATSSPSPWDAEFQRLRERLPKIKDSILFCVHALQQSPGIALDDLKAQADLHRIRVTGGSLNAARRLLRPAVVDEAVTDADSPGVPASTPAQTQSATSAQPANSEPNSAEGLPPQPLAAELRQLRERFPKTKDSILFCLYALQRSPGIPLDDVQAEAHGRGIRVTGGSLNAARRLCVRSAGGKGSTRSGSPTSQQVPEAARARRMAAEASDAPAPGSAKARLRQVIAEVQTAADARVERMRVAIRKAIAALQAVLE